MVDSVDCSAYICQYMSLQTESGEIQIEGEAAETEDEEVINPSWCQVDRVLDERKERSLDGKTQVTEYLVKVKKRRRGLAICRYVLPEGLAVVYCVQSDRG